MNLHQSTTTKNRKGKFVEQRKQAGSEPSLTTVIRTIDGLPAMAVEEADYGTWPTILHLANVNLRFSCVTLRFRSLNLRFHRAP